MQDRVLIDLAQALWEIECQYQLGLLSPLEYRRRLVTAHGKQDMNIPRKAMRNRS